MAGADDAAGRDGMSGEADAAGRDGTSGEADATRPTGSGAASSSRGLTRRRLLLGGGGVVGLAAAAAAGYAVGDAQADEGDGGASGSGSSAIVPFEGTHQAGIATPAQARLVFGSFDVVSDSADDLRELLRAWTEAARLMTAGRPTGAVAGQPELPPQDTGEALGLGPSSLTITIGVAPSLFERDGEDRFGLRARRPAALKPLGPLPGDQLDPARSGGDLCVQACADDPQVAFHAVRNLLRAGRGIAELRWLQLGFGSNTATTSGQQTPRNLMGFKDGTNNLKVDDGAALDRHVWVGDEEPQAWFRGGTYLVARRIRMLIESWDRDRLSDQEAVVGRRKVSGAPLGGRAEHDRPDLSARGADGLPTIPVDAHIRLAAPATNDGAALLRRGYAYTDGIDPRTGLLDAGLFFVAFQRDPERQFVAIQRRLGANDALTEYVQHTGSGLFAVPPGVRGRGGFVGEGLFG
ncbi:iron uptake transporter deferrochelatase/peroxidase subunit [Conexibacter sp. CPCC 206217]|uniref:iron uptake transporter deferrochelatase/peroxidase subunit n=1 Tax=Conexibacter sp. CPCC 206217 TaxID=3064574 RepID=UPI0027225EE8|nr:iron uptake transporter deferrochelatase/peroxidase subunit [Conexibacter sp. CPCC 206217]MDO8212892.1 iron uptake transporter deferrochelatase/peroxidase subunit [Conexibacter sp. CPCC 206217]